MTPTIIQTVVFLSYITFLMIKFKGPIESISNSWYLLKGWQKLLFPLFCFLMGVPMLFHFIPSTLFFISGAAISFVGMSCTYKDNWITPYIHSGGAALGIILALLGIGIITHNWIPLIVCVVSGVAIKLSKIKNGTFWTEIAAFFCILGGFLF